MEKNILPIDIVIITHSRDATLLRAVYYILKNTKLPKRVIIIHSKPERKCKNKKIIINTCKKHKIILNYIHVKHKGVSYSRNVAFKYIKSPIFGFLDDDEYPSKNWLNYAFNFFKKKRDFHVISGPKMCTDISNYWNMIWYEIYKKGFTAMGETDFVTSSNSFYKTSFINKNQIRFDNNFKNSSEDLVFSYLIKKNKGRIFFDKNLFVYHDFRKTISGFVRQWYGYGKSTYIFQKKYLKYNTKTNLFLLWNRLQGKEIFRSNSKVKFGALLMDTFFIFGYLSNIIVKNNPR